MMGIAIPNKKSTIRDFWERFFLSGNWVQIRALPSSLSSNNCRLNVCWTFTEIGKMAAERIHTQANPMVKATYISKFFTYW